MYLYASVMNYFLNSYCIKPQECLSILTAWCFCPTYRRCRISHKTINILYIYLHSITFKQFSVMMFIIVCHFTRNTYRNCFTVGSILIAHWIEHACSLRYQTFFKIVKSNSPFFCELNVVVQDWSHSVWR